MSPTAADDGDDGDAAMQNYIAQQIAALSHRGKGRYVCPLGTRCTKGGGAEQFERNCDFK